MNFDPKAVRRALMVAKNLATSIDPGFANINVPMPPEGVPLERAKGGPIKTVQGPERDQNLKDWLGDSFLHVDGVPRTYYHGTSKDTPFTSFKVGRHGAWFASDPKEASMYASQNDSMSSRYERSRFVPTNTASRVMPVYLKASNPYMGEFPEKYKNVDNYKKANSDWFDELRAAGYDSWVPRSQQGNLAVMLEGPHQVKSAVGNDGTFDHPTDITKAEGGEVDAPQGYTPQPPGTLETDNPGGKWLEEQKEYSASRGYRPSGAPMSFGEVTAVWSDRKKNEMAPVYLPVSMLKQIPGVMNEQQNVREHSLSGLVEHMGKIGRLPKFSEESTREYHPFITVDQRGMPFVNEGNHRIMAADRLGWKWLPVEVRYFNGGEDVDGPLHPDRIRAIHGVEPAKKAEGGAVDDDEIQPRNLNPMGLYSAAAEAARAIPQERGTPQQMLATMKGVRPDEINWSDVQNKFAGQKTITRDDLAQHFQDSLPPISEETSDAFRDYTVSGGDNYRALLLNIPPQAAQKAYGTDFNKYTKESHWDTPNVITHLRLKDREYSERKRTPKPDTTTNISVNTPLAPSGVGTRAIDAWSSPTPGLVVTKSLEPDERGLFRVTHVGTGLNASASKAFSFPQAMDAARRLGELWDGWEKDADAVKAWAKENGKAARDTLSQAANPLGKKALHLEELQSDWAQEGREKGFVGLKDHQNAEQDIKNIQNEASERYAKYYDDLLSSGNFDSLTAQSFGHVNNDEIERFRENVKDPEYRKQVIDNRVQSVGPISKIYELNDPDLINRHRASIEKAKALKAKNLQEAPFVTNTNQWTDLGLKRALTEAARGDYDKLIWTPGAEQADRYKLSKYIDELKYLQSNSEGPIALKGFKKGREIFNKQVSSEELNSYVGKDVAKQILESPEGRGSIKGDNLAIGGQGMLEYYDRILPRRLLALAQEHDPEAKIEPHKEARDQTKNFPSLRITPRMRKSILNRGFKAFARGGAVQKHLFNEEHESPSVKVPVMDNDKAVRRALMIAKAEGGALSGGEDHPAWIHQRLVTSKRAAPAASDERRVVNLQALQQSGDLYDKNVNALRGYPNVEKNIARRKSSDAVSEYFINHVKDNLLALHDMVPEDIRNRSKLWYDGARKIVDEWAPKYNLPDHSVSAVIAAMSPQKDWFQNVSVAKRLLDIHRGYGNEFYDSFKLNDAMKNKFLERPSLNKPEYQAVLSLIDNKSLGDIDRMSMDADEKSTAKAIWSRLYDETYHDPSHQIVTPEGEFGDFVKTAKGANAKVAWGSLGEIAKAVQSMEAAEDPQRISELMGEMHKVRNFYNNILSPNSQHKDVTIDTHAVAAGLWRPLSGNSLEVAHNFGSYAGKDMPSAGGSSITGVQGLYPLYAEAYRRAADERGLLPREMQSITWEAIRGLFPDTFKTAKNAEAINNIWNQFRQGKIDQPTARRMVYDYAGGIKNPSWVMEGSGKVNAPSQSPGNEGSLSESPVLGQPAAGIESGARTAIAPALAPQINKIPQVATGGSVDRALQIARKFSPVPGMMVTIKK